MPKLTVSMPARNTARYIGQAIASVLQERELDLELIVVDDASEDDTTAVVASFDDPRLTLLRNATRRGIGFCHNRVLRHSTAPYVAHVDSDDFVLPGALRKVVEKLEGDPRLGQVHCLDFHVDADGQTTREAFRARRRSLLGLHRGGIDYRRELVVLGMIANHLRTYRREALEEVGPFGEILGHGEDYHMSLRIADRFEIAVVPELLYAHRVHGTNTSPHGRLRHLRFWWERQRMLRRRRRSGELAFLRRPEYALGPAAWAGLLHALRIPSARWALHRWLAARRGLRGRLADAVRPAAEAIYHAALPRLSWWRLRWLPRIARRSRPAPRRIAAHLWRFPLLSETFVRRELHALAKQGYDVHVFADGPADLELAGDDARALLPATRFLEPLDPARLATWRRAFLRRRPLAFLNAFLFVCFHRYGYWKTPREDRAVFRHAVYLAGMLEEAGIDHVHAPWADRSAFVALVAARLADVTCSVQARAQELHREPERWALRAKLEEADCVLTNCRYNADVIRGLVAGSRRMLLHTIYEGVDPERFAASRRSWALDGPLRILCVARIDDQKGLEHLLAACAALQREGRDFRCDVLGGCDPARHGDYRLRLRKLHRALDLGERVHFAGARCPADVQEAYRHADLFVLPCVVAPDGSRDITPNALIEAMAMQLPVVSTSVGGIPEIVEHGVSGLLVPPGDPDALRDAIAELAADATLRERLGRQARMRVAERFDLTNNMRRFAEAFRGLGA